MLEEQWKKDLAAGGGKFFLEDILQWAEVALKPPSAVTSRQGLRVRLSHCLCPPFQVKYNDLLCLEPEYIQRYDTGYSEIRYAIQEPPEDEEEELTPEEIEAERIALEEANAAWEAKEYEKMMKAAEAKDAEVSLPCAASSLRFWLICCWWQAYEKKKAKEDALDSEAGGVEGGKKILSKKQMDQLHAMKKVDATLQPAFSQ